ncbi:MAG: hypothetical protein AB1757_26145 [Acidobacteriota bacterium]
MSQTLKQRAAELEVRVKERAEVVKKVLKDYREAARAASVTAKGSGKSRDRVRLTKKQLALEQANAEYMRLQKELDALLSRIQARKRPVRHLSR